MRLRLPLATTSLLGLLFTLSASGLRGQTDESSFNPPNSRWELDVENLHSPDISLLSSLLLNRLESGSLTWDNTIGHTLFDVDYQPFSSADVIGQPRHLIDSNLTGQIQLSHAPDLFTEYWISAGAYDGFTNHNSIWLDEYYRQQFSRFDGYIPASPWGFNASTGLVRDFGRWPGVVGASVSFSQDDVAPGYERPLFQDLERGRERLFTAGLNLSLETVPFARVRLRHELGISDVTDRDPRFNYRGNLNFALNETWVARGESTFTLESSRNAGQTDFHAGSLAVTLERDWDQTWFLSAHARGYRDNGQIETSILVSASPPPLETTEWGLTLRHRGDRWSWKLGAAIYQTRFEEIDSPIRPFGNLYRDRDWVLLDSTLSITY